MSFIWWLALGMILIDILLKLLPPVCYWMTMAGLSTGSWSYYVNSSLRSPHRCVHSQAAISDIQTWLRSSTRHYTQFRFRSIHKKTGNHLRHQINLTYTRTCKIQGYVFNFEIFVLCGSWSKFCFVSFKILDQIGQTKRDKNGLYLGFIWIKLYYNIPILSVVSHLSWWDTCQGPQH